MKLSYRYIYGPVSSWRLGRSLGIDPISRENKVCTFNCVYCQLGHVQLFSDKREVFVPTKDIIEEINSLPDLRIDYITFSGKGEPTLAENLGGIIIEIKKIRDEKIAVITNSSLIDRADVQRDLSLADLVIAKIDAYTSQGLEEVNQPMKSITFDRIFQGIKDFREHYKGKLALQIMFVQANKMFAKEIAMLSRRIYPDEVQLNTPLRLCSVKPLSKKEMDRIKLLFEGMNVVSVYEAEKKAIPALSIKDTLMRRGRL